MERGHVLYQCVTSGCGPGHKGSYQFTCLNRRCGYAATLFVGIGGHGSIWQASRLELFTCGGCRSFYPLNVFDSPESLRLRLVKAQAALRDARGGWFRGRNERSRLRAVIADIERWLESALRQQEGFLCPTCGSTDVSPLTLHERTPCPRCGELGRAERTLICWD